MSTAQVTARLSADASDFKSKLSDAESHVGKVSKGITQKFELKDLGRTMAAAVGLNIESIGKAVARMATGMTVEMEAAFGRVVAASDRATDVVIAHIRKLGSAETQYQAMLQERARLQDTLDKKQANAADIAPTSWWARIKSSPFSGPFFDHGLAAAEEYAANNKAALDENLAKATKLDEQIKTAEAERVKNATLEAEARAKWVGSLKEGVVVSKESLDIDKNRLTTAEQITDEVEKQNVVVYKGVKMTAEKLAQIKATLAEMNQKSYTDTIFAMTSGSLGDAEIRRMGDEALQEKVRRLRNDLLLNNLVPAGINDIGKLWGNTAVSNDIAKITQELNLRTGLRREVDRVGIEGARRTFRGDPMSFDQLVQEFVVGRTETMKTNQLLQKLNDKMDKGLRIRAITTPGSDAFAA